jgi:hypothetical protein
MTTNAHMCRCVYAYVPQHDIVKKTIVCEVMIGNTTKHLRSLYTVIPGENKAGRHVDDKQIVESTSNKGYCLSNNADCITLPV